MLIINLNRYYELIGTRGTASRYRFRIVLAAKQLQFKLCCRRHSASGKNRPVPALRPRL